MLCLLQSWRIFVVLTTIIDGSSAIWNPDATTFADVSEVGVFPTTVFIDRDNSVYVAEMQQDRVQMWLENQTVPVRNITGGLLSPHGLFVTANGEVYVDNGCSQGRVDGWSVNGTTGTTVMNVSGCCDSLFVGIAETLYCTTSQVHQVVKQSSSSTTGPASIVVAGNGTAGNSSTLLSRPQGIFVDRDLSLYVADAGNNRIQKFPVGELNATTVAGSVDSLAGNVILNGPCAVTLDADGYLFIADSNNNRIIGSGPNGFRCIVGCTGSPGNAADQLQNPWSLSFDRYGNLFVTDRNNSRIQKFMLATNSCGISYNQPTFCPSATWGPNAVTFTDQSSSGGLPWGVFINAENAVYFTVRTVNRIEIWNENNRTSRRRINSNWGNLLAVFVTINGDIYIALNNPQSKIHQVICWKANATSNQTAMIEDNRCYGLFVDIYDNIYCSMDGLHSVAKQSFNDPVNVTTIIAGNRTAAAASNTLSSPRGIFVTVELHLYVADCGNDRVQLFQSGERNATTVVGTGSTATIQLSCPTAIILDGDGYLFIADYNHSRIVGSGPTGFRCVAGCAQSSGLLSDPLNNPCSLSFDSYGNIFVVDDLYHRVQKFSLSTNSCGISYNQPTFCPSATWNPNATTFADANTSVTAPFSVFVDQKNSVYLAEQSRVFVQFWLGGNATSPVIVTNASNPSYAVFVTVNGDIYADSSGSSVYQVKKWNMNATSGVVVMNVNNSCFGLFVDIDGNIYCSMLFNHLVVKRAFDADVSNVTRIAGTGQNGSTSNMLQSPRGIWVDTHLNLYVADSGNNRIQRFSVGQANASTVVGNGAPGTIDLDTPSDVILDGNDYLFITELYGSRIIGSGPYGYRCIAGCSQVISSAPDQLSRPRSLSFDSFGNLFVVDGLNNRIQQFLLADNSCAPPGPVFTPSTCPNLTMMGVYCNASSQPCDILQPCLNNALCINNNTVSYGYLCQCPSGFEGVQCENDRRPCQANTCWNGGTCNQTSQRTFICQCLSGWEGDRCERKVNYCSNVTCQNEGVCRSLLGDYRCECLASSYSGQHCEITLRGTALLQVIARSFAAVAIIAMASAVAFIVIMDLLKYVFGIDPVSKELKMKQATNKKKKAKARTIIVVRYLYLHASTTPPTASVELQAIA